MNFKRIINPVKLNQKYGKMTIIDNKLLDGHKVLCRCDCGKEKPVIIYHLKSGNTVSCGCYRIKTSNSRFKSMINKEEIDKLALEMVVMNDDLCYHGASFNGDSITPAFPHPIYTWRLMAGNKSVRASIRCPVCRTEYKEASERLAKELFTIYNRLSKEEKDGTNLGTV